MVITILVFLLVLTVLVLIHEFGHFFVAKKFKIKVEEFGFGLPPRIWGKKIGETVYSLNWLPIGGFVKLYGEDDAGAGRITQKIRRVVDKSRAFYARPPWQKAMVVIAGVFMNFLLAVVVFSFLFALVGIAVPGDRVVVNNVVKGSPAYSSGIKVGDRITYINSIKITSTQQLIDETKKNQGREITLRITSPRSDSGQAGQVEKTVKITPRINYPKGEGPMGVGISQNVKVKKYSWYQAPVAGVREAFSQSILLVKAGGNLLGQIISSGRVPEYSVAGPIGIAQLTGRYIEFGPTVVLSFVSLLSLNLAILNILPIPALDGGRLFFILIEMFTRRRVHPKFESYAHTIGMALLLALIALITFHDLTRLISGQPLIPR